MTYIGYAIGTVYQYFFLKIVTKLFVGATVDALPEITFSVAGFFSTLALFIVSYELLMLFYRRRVSKVSLKEIMQQ